MSQSPVRAGIVVTGTEVLTGRIADKNGPWVSERLAELGIEVAHILIVADRIDAIQRQLAELLRAALTAVGRPADPGADLPELVTAARIFRFQ